MSSELTREERLELALYRIKSTSKETHVHCADEEHSREVHRLIEVIHSECRDVLGIDYPTKD